jgi:hypothetical protein
MMPYKMLWLTFLSLTPPPEKTNTTEKKKYGGGDGVAFTFETTTIVLLLLPIAQDQTPNATMKHNNKEVCVHSCEAQLSQGTHTTLQ